MSSMKASGVNPNEKENSSFELIKRYKDNILIGIKLDKDGDYLYVATMHEVQESKIVRRLHSGRIKEVITECEKTALKTEKIILTKKKLNKYSF